MARIKLTWSLNIGSSDAAIADAGGLSVDALTKASVTVDAGADSALDLEHADLANLLLLAVRASRYDGTVSVKGPADSDPEIALTGPLVLHGAAVGLLGGGLATLTVGNAGTEAADVDLLIGRALANPT